MPTIRSVGHATAFTKNHFRPDGAVATQFTIVFRDEILTGAKTRSPGD